MRDESSLPMLGKSSSNPAGLMDLDLEGNAEANSPVLGSKGHGHSDRQMGR